MSNEELSMRIQAGDVSLYGQLMEQCKGFIFSWASKWANAFRGRPDIDIEDLTQCSFFAVLEAVERFTPERGAFLSILSFTLQTAFQVACGVRTAEQRNEPMYKNCLRLEGPASSEPDEKRTIADTVEDDSSMEAAADNIYRYHANKVIKEALATLPERQRGAIEMYYFQGKTYSAIASDLGVSLSGAESIIKNGFRNIRNGKYMENLSELYYESRNLYKGTGLRTFRQRGSVQESTVLYQERVENRIWYGTRAERIRCLVDVLGVTRETAEQIADEKTGA